MEFDDLAQVCCEQYKIISIVGAGGKTSLMYELAERCSRRGISVLAGTTTHIYKPEHHYARGAEEAVRLWKKGSYAVVGEETAEGKLREPSEEIRGALLGKAGLVILEADGAKGFPCKAPGEWEPVIWDESDFVIGVLGMSAVGKSMRECCFRLEEAVRAFGISPDTILSEDLAVSILSSPSGTRKGVGSREYAVVLNQCDTEEIRKRAERIREGLEREGISKVMLTCFQK